MANGYVKSGGLNLNIVDYNKLNVAMRLDEYEVQLTTWEGGPKAFKPLEPWLNGHRLPWYTSYNNVKHNRFENFREASLANVIDAVGAVFCILFAQFHVFVLDPYHPLNQYDQAPDGTLAHDSCMLRIRPPSSWSTGERYAFDWKVLKLTADPLQKYHF